MKTIGGCGIFISKSFSCTSNVIESNRDRICAVLSEFASLTILFISVYMPGDTYTITYEFSSVLSVVQALQAKYNPVHIYVGEILTPTSPIMGLVTQNHFANSVQLYY